MSPIELLINEHRYIVLVLDCLSKMVEESLTRKKLNFLRAEEVVDFFRNFADKWHHKKEEDILFKIMIERGLTGDSDYVADLTGEHEKGRSHVKGMDDAFREAAHGDMKEVMNFGRHAREYIDLLKGHILKEDRIVFPYVEEFFTDDDMHLLTDKFIKAGKEDDDKDTETKYINIANSLALVYNIKTFDEDF